MNKKYTLYIKGILATCCLVPLNAFADGDDGNRYNLERRYASEISASAAYLATNIPQGFGNGKNSAVILDVRTIEEYVGGHPPGAYSMPYPHINNRQCANPESECHDTYIGQEDDTFVEAVDALGLRKDALIITMCRTGYRSVGAANLLADAGYTNVKNMWEGFKGNLKTNTAGDELDLDGVGGVDSSVYSGDLDGWANFAGLPVSYKLKHWQLYPEYMDLYYTVDGVR